MDITLNTMIHNVKRNVHYLIQLVNPRMRVRDYNWVNLVDLLSDYRPRLFYHLVSWESPSEGQQKCNTDRASKGNTCPSSYGFCIGNHNGDLCYAQAGTLGHMPNIEVGTMTIL